MPFLTVSFLVGKVPLLKETTEKSCVPTYSNVISFGPRQISGVWDMGDSLRR